MVEMDQNSGDEIFFTKYPLEWRPCIRGVDFRKDLIDAGAFHRNLDKFVCLASQELEFLGTLVSP